MGERTGIQWCDSTATPVIGCWPVSPGCANCWARNDTPARVLRAGKWPGHPQPFETWTKDGPRYRVKGFADTLRRMNARPWVCDECGKSRDARGHRDSIWLCPCGAPNHKSHRRRVFIGDSCDLFDPAWPVELLSEVLGEIYRASELQLILCTKRPELWPERLDAVLATGWDCMGWLRAWRNGQIAPSLCVLASVENQELAEARVPALLRIPARWHGLSCEPLLGPVDLTNSGGVWSTCRGTVDARVKAALDWLILGCESLQGKAGRFADGYVDAAASLIRQGQAAGVAVFHKQMPVGGLVSGDPQAWEVELGVRQWPEGM